MSAKTEYLNAQRVKNRLGELLDQIASIDEEKIALTAARVCEIESRRKVINGDVSTFPEELSAILNAIQIETSEQTSFTFTCSKTGQPIAQINPQHFQSLIEVAGKDKALHVIRREHITKIHPAWYYTGKDELQNLSLVDPVGYAVYAISKIFHPYFHKKHTPKNTHNIDRQKQEEVLYLWHTLLHSLWQNLKDCSPATLVELNEMLHRFNAVVDVKYVVGLVRWSTTDLTAVQPRILLSELRGNIKRLGHYLHKKGQWDITQPYTNFATFVEKFHGHSQFRKADRGNAILRSNLLTETDVLALELAEVFKTNTSDEHRRATIQHAVLKAERTKRKGFRHDTKAKGGMFALKFGPDHVSNETTENEGI